MDSLLIKGIFIEEANSRFLCSVYIDGKEEICYVSNSSKLSRFISLKGRVVLLIKNIGINIRTKYTLYAVKTEMGYALLNLVYINKLLFSEFNKPEHPYLRLGKIYPEKKINDTLKVDFFIDGEKDILIEAKGILTERQTAKFPAMKVARAERQLLQFEKLLKKNIGVHYYIILMNDAIKDVEFDIGYKEFIQPFKSCIKKGMELYIYKVIWEDEFRLSRDYQIERKLKQSIL